MSEGKAIVKKETAVVTGTTPADLLRIAVEGNADIDKLEKLMDLQIRWDENQAKKAYVKSISAFKANPPKIVKDSQVAYKDVRYKHATLGNVVGQISSALSEHGLSASWETRQDSDKLAVTVVCKITHIMGHSEQTSLTAQPDGSGSKNSIQAIGSTITYLQRYTLLALTGLATYDQDDDGQGAGNVEYIDDKQLGQIKDYIDNSTVNEDKFNAHFGIESLDKMPKAKFAQAMGIINQHAEGQKK